MMLTGTCAMPNEMSLWKTGMLTTALTGQSMAQTTSRQAAVATVESIALGETLAPSRPPAKRPTSITTKASAKMPMAMNRAGAALLIVACAAFPMR